MTTKVNIIKNAACLTMIALCILIVFSCGNYLTKAPENNGTPNISMIVMQYNNRVILYMAGSDKITIDWWNGIVKEKKLKDFNDNFFGYNHNYKYRVAHFYFGTTARTIKISGNNITHLRIAHEKLTSLDVSGATTLKWLDCWYTQLTELDVSTNTELTDLWCQQNQLTKLDLSTNTELISLICSKNQLTSLDLNANTALTTLNCSNNQLTELDMSTNTTLMILYCESNNLSTAALNTLFETLHDDILEQEKILHIGGNPGTIDCNKSIAERKGWKVYY